MAKLNDPDIRKAFYKDQIYRFLFHPDILVTEEVNLLRGKARIDILIVGNRHLHGYEIKGESDTTKRLPHQSVVYGRSLHRVTLMTSPKHLEEALRIIPYWWGIIIVTSENKLPKFKRARKSLLNPDINPSSLTQMLWKNESHDILKRHGLYHRSLYSGSRRAYWKMINDGLSLETIQEEVCSSLKKRENWRNKVYLGNNEILDRI